MVSMTVVISTIFPDFGMLLTDSRVTWSNGTKRDELQKIYQLSDHLAVAFSSADVGITLQIIKEMTTYSLKKSRSKHVLFLLDKLIKVAIYHYGRLTKNMTNKPLMDFSFVGVLRDRSTSLQATYFMELIKHHNGSGFTLSPEMTNALFRAKEGQMSFPPPVPIAAHLIFPLGLVRKYHTLGVHVTGSGSGVWQKLKNEMGKILLQPHKEMRISVLHMTVDEYCKENSSSGVGGLSQVVLIDSEGVRPRSYETAQLDKDGKVVKGHRMIYTTGGWVQQNIETGTEIRVHQNPRNEVPGTL